MRAAGLTDTAGFSFSFDSNMAAGRKVLQEGGLDALFADGFWCVWVSFGTCRLDAWEATHVVEGRL
jgi:hypothetical protein